MSQLPSLFPPPTQSAGPPSNADTSGGDATAPVVSDRCARQQYFRGLGLVSLIAFVSLWTQIHGLVGSEGLLPAERFFQRAYLQLGNAAYLKLPSLCWLGSNDGALHAWCAGGVVLSVLLTVGIAPRVMLVLLWGAYLSLTVAGQQFLSFQWDTLLLEMYACSLLYAPRGWIPDWKRPSVPLPAARWLVWLLAFKLMFLSGVTKLLSGDPAWHDGTALQFHYYTQPIPSWPSWYAAQCPTTIHQASLVVMFTIEVVGPFLIFFGRRGRAIFGIATILLMGAIEATGNFGFFNLQTAVLCVPLIDDPAWHRLIPARGLQLLRSPISLTSDPTTTPVNKRLRFLLGTGFAASMLAVSMLTLVREMVRTQQSEKLPAPIAEVLRFADWSVLSWSEAWVLNPLAPFRTVNGYGLFRVMTTRRPEIILEISEDGLNWKACEFRYKPGAVDRAPPIVAPQMPRLDWQMWFAALNPRGSEVWLAALTERILEGNATTAYLLGHPELIKQPPRFVRLAYYEYKFSSWDQRHVTGAWWSRSHLGYLTSPRSRRS